ncbi:OLC1v1005949C1 [Oldenlandia corymbosa var. corymbosa]|uniref:OLC1v1005949C1 n=1 Tax=Oldenlandia corymbosa var. corymbosa TaxID=529605 RepID=A0AAV1DG64_OLDCO|nr:OLC1v1005949C1 [Oldenlandia corymbosa var. corymbosa]
MDATSDDDGGFVGRFLRIRVSLDLDKPLRSSLEFTYKNFPRTCQSRYERLPSFWFLCGRIGHLEEICEDATSKSASVPPKYGPLLKASPPFSPFSTAYNHPSPIPLQIQRNHLPPLIHKTRKPL